MLRMLAFAALLGISIPVEAQSCKNHFILDSPCEIAAVAWRPAANPLASHGSEHTATRLGDGRVLVVGGAPDIHHDSASRTWIAHPLATSAEIYDPVADSWTWTAAINLQRWGHTATLLRDGRVLVVGGGVLVSGGRIDWTNEPELRRSAEIFDPGTNAWSFAGSLAFPRAGHTATLMPTGEVLVVGGQWLDEAVAASEVFDPATGRWRVAASLSEPRYSHTATALPGGVIVVGGIVEFWGDTHAQHAEFFDSATASWSPAGSPLPRAIHTATSLPDGRVLIAADCGTGRGWKSAAAGNTTGKSRWTRYRSMTGARAVGARLHR
jgi:hypothetical protein